MNVVLAAAAIARARSCSTPTQTAFVLGAYGIAMPATRLVAADDAVPAADAVGYPVAVKALHRHVGRSLHAGVALDLADAGVGRGSGRGDARGCSATMPTRVVVQAMTAPGLDLRVRVTVDPSSVRSWRSVSAAGPADLLADEARRLAPLSAQSAEALVGGLARRSRRSPRPASADHPRRRRAARRPARRRPPPRRRHRPQPGHRHRRRVRRDRRGRRRRSGRARRRGAPGAVAPH